jgi:protein-tyrosine phosphatase
VIDTHCHLLPGVDDGPRDEREALALAARLVSEGVTRVLCTPHYSRLFVTLHEDAVERRRALQARLDALGIALETAVAAEIGPELAVSEPLEEIRRRSVAGRFTLIELLPDSPAGFLPLIQDRLASSGLVPIYAHPERCRALQRNPGLLDGVRRDGALVQVVAPSLIGRWGSDVEAAAWRLVDTGRADLLGSDAHGSKRRRPHLREACVLIAERLGLELVVELTERRPARVLAGQATAGHILRP